MTQKPTHPLERVTKKAPQPLDTREIILGHLLMNGQDGSSLVDLRELTGLSKKELRAFLQKLDLQPDLGTELIDKNRGRLTQKPAEEKQILLLDNFSRWAMGEEQYDLARQAQMVLYLKYNEARDDFNAAKCLGKAGVVCLTAEKPDLAAPYFEKSFLLHKELNDPQGMGRDAANLASALASLGKGREALEQLDLAIEKFEQAQEPAFAARARLDKAKLMDAMGLES